MYLERIEYENYRNLEKGVFVPDEAMNVIYGENAQGKTNLIEAIWLFTGRKSFRGTKDTQLINIESKNQTAVLKANFFSEGRHQTGEIIITNKRLASMNDVNLSSASGMSEKFSAILFSPADMDLVKEGPLVRRKFLDNAISTVRPKYEKILQAYNRAVMQRNAILKDVAFHRELEFMLDVYDERIAKSGAYIIAQRKKYIEALMDYIVDIYSGISSNKEEISIKYKSTAGAGSEAEILKSLKETRKQDTVNATTNVGPHRDDMEFFINGLSLKIFGSQGQRRSAIIALKLSEAEILKKNTGEQPIAILDDVMSELDLSRQDYLLNHIKGWQVFITCCDPNNIKMLDNGKVFKIENGVLSEEKCLPLEEEEPLVMG